MFTYTNTLEQNKNSMGMACLRKHGIYSLLTVNVNSDILNVNVCIQFTYVRFCRMSTVAHCLHKQENCMYTVFT